MAVFNYIAVNKTGKTRKGILSGDSASQVRQILQEQELIPVEITPAVEERQPHPNDTRSKWKLFRMKERRVTLSQLTVMTFTAATLLSAGMPVEAMLGHIATELDHPTFKRILLSVRTKVIEGHTFAASLSEHPHIFPKLYIASVAVGEKTGQLDKVLNRLADYYEKQRQVRDKVFQALIYPTLLTLVAGSVVVFLLTYVIPGVTDVFIQTGQSLPSVTMVLLSISRFLKNYGLYCLLAIIMGVFAFWYSLKNLRFRYKVHQTLLRTPVLKNTIIAVNTSRFLRTFGILFAAGIPVLDAMRSANSIITLLPMQEAIADAITKVGEGSPIHK